MSTRANIKMTDGHTTLWAYRHSDGYPSCTGESLKEFVKGYSGKYRDNPIQSMGHLILHGHNEYKKEGLLDSDFYNWKAGAYEPTDGRHADIKYLYTIDLAKKELRCRNLYAKKTTKLAEWL